MPASTRATSDTNAEGPAERYYSKDYWDLVLEQLGRRRLFRAGLMVLTCLYGVAAFAPLLVNDKPFAIESVDLDAYSSAVRTLRSAVSSAGRVVGQDDAVYAKSIEGKDKAPPSRGAAFAVELGAARVRIDTMRRYLPRERVGPLDELDTHLARASEAFDVDAKFVAGLGRAGLLDASITFDRAAVPDWAGARDAAVASEAIDAAKDLASTLRKELAPWDPTKPEVEGVDLVGQREHPLWVSLKPWEISAMTLWLLWFLWPLWNRVVNRGLLRGDRERVRRARSWKIGGVLALSLLAAVGWRATVGPGRSGLDVAPHKEGLVRGSIHLVAEGHTLREAKADPTLVGRVTWAPVCYGYAETTVVEKFREPTWRAEAAIDPATGRYTHPKWLLDAETVGDRTVGQALVVRAGEPEANAWDRHLAGTDEIGRDFFGRMIWGSRVSLSVGIISALLLTCIGVVIGSIAGYFGGRVDTLIMRLIEIMQSIPSFFLILLAMAFTDPKVVPPIFAIVIVIGLVSWTGVARLVRGEFMRLREQEFVVAARALGFSNARTIFGHVLPNAISPVLVAAAFSVAAGILIESAISFLGFGVQPPDASWGSLVNETRNPTYWWIQVFPGLLIFVTVTCYNLVGDAVRDALDPKMKV